MEIWQRPETHKVFFLSTVLEGGQWIKNEGFSYFNNDLHSDNYANSSGYESSRLTLLWLSRFVSSETVKINIV